MTSPHAPTSDQVQLLEQLRAATLGEYEVYGELGRGGMATVFLAHELSLDRKVAIKVMAPGLLSGPGMVERFKREARTAASLSHPNIIPIYGVREAGGLIFFVMKLIEGTPLDSVMRELGQLPVPMVEAILAQVGGAFGYAHRRGVIHRDIKPSNILIDDEGWAVVTDFGIAKVAESEGLTQTGMSVGTPTYMSPEQCGGGEITGASDQYALGVVAYEMLAGRPPFTAATAMGLMYSHYNEAAPPLETFRADIPAQLGDAVIRMLEKDPKARFPSVEDAIAVMGAKQLAHDDPNRSQLILLARSSSAHRIVSQVQTPRSPIPLTPKGGGLARSTGTTTAAGEPPPWKRRLLMLELGGFAAAAAVIAYLVLRPDPAPAPAPADPAAVATDSLPAAPPVVAATPPAPPPAAERPEVPERREQPERREPSERPERSEARSVAPAGTGALPPAPAPAPSPAPVPAPPPPAPVPVAAPAPAPAPNPPPAESRPPVATSPAADDRAAVVSVIESYARALDQGDLAAVRRIYIGIPAEQRQGLEAFWRAGGTMRTRWAISEVVVNGDEATARVQGVNAVSTPRERPSEQRVNLRARLERRNGEWRLVSLVN